MQMFSRFLNWITFFRIITNVILGDRIGAVMFVKMAGGECIGRKQLFKVILYPKKTTDRWTLNNPIDGEVDHRQMCYDFFWPFPKKKEKEDC